MCHCEAVELRVLLNDVPCFAISFRHQSHLFAHGNSGCTVDSVGDANKSVKQPGRGGRARRGGWAKNQEGKESTGVKKSTRRVPVITAAQMVQQMRWEEQRDAEVRQDRVAYGGSSSGKEHRVPNSTDQGGPK
ncbi:hypothetical protein Q8A73_007071 [Channa argus]|nr:hypothetical protein Q8A73_007071 [Channa argus]